MNKDKLVILLILLLCLVVSFLFCIRMNNVVHYGNEVHYVDTVYDVHELNSINNNIKIKDSIINNLKIDMQYEIEQALNNDSFNAVEQFKSLAGSK